MIDATSRARLQVAIGLATSEDPLTEDQLKILHEICKKDPWVYQILKLYIREDVLVAAAQ